MGDSGDQDNQRDIIEDTVDGVTIVIDPTDVVLAKVLTQLFGPLSPRSNPPSGIFAGSNLLLAVSAICIG